MVENLEIRKKDSGYLILEQAGSNYHAERSLYEAADRAGAEAWLAERGAAQADVARALDDAGTAESVFIEIAGDYAEAENFPRERS